MPNLTEPGVKYFLDQTLKKCHKKKCDYNNFKYKPSIFKTNQLYLIQSMAEVAQE